MADGRLGQVGEIWRKVGGFEGLDEVFAKHHSLLKQSINACSFPMLLHGIRGLQRDADEMICKALMALRDGQITDGEYALLAKVIDEVSTDMMVSAYGAFKRRCLRR
jgi:hypothetical protein